MAKVLYITANPKEESRSYGKTIGRHFLEAYASARPDDDIFELDLYRSPVQLIDADILSAWASLQQGAAMDELTARQKQKLAALNELTAQFVGADLEGGEEGERVEGGIVRQAERGELHQVGPVLPYKGRHGVDQSHVAGLHRGGEEQPGGLGDLLIHLGQHGAGLTRRHVASLAEAGVGEVQVQPAPRGVRSGQHELGLLPRALHGVERVAGQGAATGGRDP